MWMPCYRYSLTHCLVGEFWWHHAQIHEQGPNILCQWALRWCTLSIYSWYPLSLWSDPAWNWTFSWSQRGKWTPHAAHTECMRAGFEEMVANFLIWNYLAAMGKHCANRSLIYMKQKYVTENHDWREAKDRGWVKIADQKSLPKVFGGHAEQTWMVSFKKVQPWPPPYCITNRKRLARDSWQAGLLLRRSAFTSSNFTWGFCLDFFSQHA